MKQNIFSLRTSSFPHMLPIMSIVLLNSKIKSAQQAARIENGFRHLYDVRKGKLSCDFHTPSFSLPNRGYEKAWNHLYNQKDGKIQFSNFGNATTFITRSGNTGANLTSLKERGYFEYLIKN